MTSLKNKVASIEFHVNALALSIKPTA